MPLSKELRPRDRVEDALRRLTDGSITFRLEEDDYSIAAAFEMAGEIYTHMWPKWKMENYQPDAQDYADKGVRELLAKAVALP